MARVHLSGFEPMLATASRWLEGNGWAFEPKLDGSPRSSGVCQVELFARRGAGITGVFPRCGRGSLACPAKRFVSGCRQTTSTCERSAQLCLRGPDRSMRWGHSGYHNSRPPFVVAHRSIDANDLSQFALAERLVRSYGELGLPDRAK